jgi:hypothetical protein
MSIQIPIINPSPLKARIEKLNLKLWQLKVLLGGKISMGHISNMLNQIAPMPKEVEDKLEHILTELEKQQSQVQIISK